MADTETLVTWEELKAWALAHGAKNDRITSMVIDGVIPNFTVTIVGNELVDGKPFMSSRGEVARWQIVSPLRSLPAGKP